MRTPRLAPPILMLLVAACAQAQPLIPAAQTQEVVVDMGIANGRTARVALAPDTRYALKDLVHSWVAGDITQYDVHLEVATTDHNTYAELASPPLVAHVPIAGNASTAQAVFEHLSPGKYYRAYVTALGRKDGTAGTGTAVALNTAHALTDSTDFDFTTPQGQDDDPTQTVKVHFDGVDFAGAGTLNFASPADGGYKLPALSPSMTVSAVPPIPSGTLISNINVGSAPWGVAVDPNNGNVWVSNNTNPGTMKVLSSTGVLISNITVGTFPAGIAVDPNNGQVWITNNAPTLPELSSTGALTRNVNLGSGSVFVAVDPRNDHVWVAAGSTLKELSSTGTLITNILGLGSANALAVDPNNGNVWVANQTSGTVTELSSTGALISTIPVGSNPQGVAVDPRNGNVWVANQTSGTVTELSSTGVLISTIPAGNLPGAVAVDPSNGNVWIVNINNPGAVTELSSTGVLISHIPVRPGPLDVVVDGNGHVWVTNHGDGTVSELQH